MRKFLFMLLVLVCRSAFGADYFYIDNQDVGYNVYSDGKLTIAFIPDNSTVVIPPSIKIDGQEYVVDGLSSGYDSHMKVSGSDITLPSISYIQSFYSVEFINCKVRITDLKSWCGMSASNGISWTNSEPYVEGKLLTELDGNVSGPVSDPVFSGHLFEKVYVPSFDLNSGYKMYVKTKNLYVPDAEHLARFSMGITGESETIFVGGEKLAGMLVIPEGITSLPSYFLQSYSHITGVTLPSSLKSMSRAFNSCEKLSTVICNSTDVSCSGSFYGCPIKGPTLYVGDMLVHVGAEESGVFVIREGTKNIRVPYHQSGKSWSLGAFSNTPNITSIVDKSTCGWRRYSDASGQPQIILPNSCGATSIVSENTASWRNLGDAMWGKEKYKDKYKDNDNWFVIPYCVEHLEIPAGWTRPTTYHYKPDTLIMSLPRLKSLSLTGKQFVDMCYHEYSTVLQYKIYYQSREHLSTLELTDANDLITKDRTKFRNVMKVDTLVLRGNSSNYRYTLDGVIDLAAVRAVRLYDSNATYLQFANVEEVVLPACGGTNGHFGEMVGSPDGTKVLQLCENGNTRSYNVPASLRRVFIDEGCTEVPFGAFYNFSMLDHVTLPSTLTIVGEKAFHGCSGLTSLRVKSAIPPAAYDNAFEGMRLGFCRLIVPVGSADLYRKATGWQQFSIIEEDGGVILTLKPNIREAGDVIGALQYNYGETISLRAVANSGYKFSHWASDGRVLGFEPELEMTAVGSMVLEPVYSAVAGDNDVAVSSSGDGVVVISFNAVEGATEYNIRLLDNSGNVMAEQRIADDRVSRNGAQVQARFDGLDCTRTYQYLISAVDSEECIEEFRGVLNPGVAGITEIGADATLVPFVVSRNGINMLESAGRVEIYTLAGRLAFSRGMVCAGESIPLAHGFYVVVVDGRAFKVVI